MKSLLLTALVLTLPSYVMAETPQIRAEQHTCQELQEVVRNYGEVTVVYRPLFFKKKRTVSAELDCPASSTKIQFVVKSSDALNCSVGFFCKTIPEVTYHYPDTRPRREPFPPHHYDHHDHYNPPTRHETGPRYNPPSRSEHGPRYNPCRARGC